MGTPQGMTLTESVHPLAFLVSEDSDGAGYLSREQAVIAASQTIVVGQVLSTVAVPANVTSTAALLAGNTGNGTIAAGAADATVKEGVYRITFTDATHALVEDPDGEPVGEAVVGVAFSRGVTFTLTAGGTAFVAGDRATVSVDVPSTATQYVAYDGTKPAAAIAGYPAVTGAGQTARIAIIDSHATVRLSDLTFFAGATAADIDRAKADLAKKLVKFR